MSNFFIALYRFFKGHKAVFYGILIVTTAVFAWFASQVHFEENIATLLPKTRNSRECAVAFGNIKVKDKLFIEIQSAQGTQSNPDSLAARMDEFVEYMTSTEESSEYIGNVFYTIDTDDIMNIVYYAIDALPCHLSDKAYPVIDSCLNEETIEAYATGEKKPGMMSAGNFTIINHHLFSPDSALALAFVAPAFEALDTKLGNRFETFLTRTVDEFQSQHPDCEVLYHGNVSNGTYNSRQIKKDLAMTVGVSMLLICLIICISFRSRRTLIYLVLPVVHGSLFALACVYFITGQMSLIAMAIGAIVLGVALSYCLHVITHRKFVNDVEQVIREQARPVFLGCLTTIGAFAGLLFTSSELLRDFGIFASLALIGTTFFALAFLPQFFGEKDGERNEKIFGWVNRVNSYPLDRNKAVVISLIILCIVCFFTSGNVGFDSDLGHIGYKEPKIKHSEDVYNAHVNNGGLSNIFYAAHADSLDGAIVYSRRMNYLLDSAKKAGLIASYRGTDGILIPQDEQRANIRRWKEYWQPGKVDAAVKLLEKEDAKYGWSDKVGMDIPSTLRFMAEMDCEPQSIYDSGIIPESLMCNFVEENKDGWLVFSSALMDRKNKREVDNIIGNQEHLVVLDPFFYTGDMVEIVHNDFSTVLLISSIFVFVVLLLSFRSVTISLIAFTPMFLSWYIVQGLMAIFGIEFNLINIMISTFIFGIGVDYSIFVMEGQLGALRSSTNDLLICHKAAIFYSGLILIIVTASLLFATHPAIYSIGISTLIGMSSTILITYALQPLLFRLAMKNGFLRRRAMKI